MGGGDECVSSAVLTALGTTTNNKSVKEEFERSRYRRKVARRSKVGAKRLKMVSW